MWVHKDDELQHYGVLGMRWGVRRTPDQLRRAAGKLERRNEKLQKKYVNTNLKSAKIRDSAYGLFTPKKTAERRLYQADKLEARGKRYLARMMKNEETQSIFNNTAKALDEGKVLAGNRFMMKYEKETLKKQLG